MVKIVKAVFSEPKRLSILKFSGHFFVSHSFKFSELVTNCNDNVVNNILKRTGTSLHAMLALETELIYF